MADDAEEMGRKPRADAQRNRGRLLAAAKQAFAEKGVGVSLEEIARTAGLGIGTLYRHFPTRDALVEEVYRHETSQLATAAERLAAELPPVEALREWMLLFVDYLATKLIMAEALGAMVSGREELHAASGTMIKAAIATLAERAAESGAIRLSIAPLDLLRAVFGVSNASAGPGWEENAKRLVDILIAGMRVPPQG
ncbi:TetR/AcrR family transcriptional regulator [Roseococcus pinisoli]|uniref:TetR family transcriptional regulator n=1 Tax=Roseococcus pinisoli TaxID=2835040 RepID=A0ABS5QEK5_9PROT|nr:TetR family transcriptional regulator [Roseococcus pinisoli]MBS7812129.1 TetR family transcriptional regulator [Roseococcus pinisoli]